MIDKQTHLRINLALKRSVYLKQIVKEDFFRSSEILPETESFFPSYWQNNFLSKSVRFNDSKDPVFDLREKFAESRLALRDRLSSFFGGDDCGCDESD